jgi:hypothetical protein
LSVPVPQARMIAEAIDELDRLVPPKHDRPGQDRL